MTNNKETQKASWDDGMDIWLKPKHFSKTPLTAFIVKLKIVPGEEDKVNFIYSVNVEGGKYQWQPNKTQMNQLMDLKIKSPNDLINKNVDFKVITVRNPSTKQMQDGLDIMRVQ